MIEIRHHILPRIGMIEIDGHAEAGEYGNDPICAAVSILTITLRMLCGAEIASGHARIIYSTGVRDQRIWAEFALEGYRFLAEKFPDHVHYQEIRGDG